MKKIRYHSLNANEIKVQGWIKDQLICQAQGLSGHLHEFWPDISDSKWIGGQHEGWERVPYWLDGFIPLAFLLDDKNLKKTAEFYIKNIIDKQQEDGWIAPCSLKERAKYDHWGIFIILKPLMQYYDLTHDKDVFSAIKKTLFQLNQHLNQYPLFDWGKYRWFECLIPILWLYEKQPSPWLIELAHKLYQQGFDYADFYSTNFPKKRVKTGEWRFDTHGVNNAMAIKSYALMSLIDKNIDKKISDKMIKTLNKYHGAISGTFNADECLAGLSPSSGSELCLIVELMYSLECLSLIDGNNRYQEQLERLAFNALPSCFTRDMWCHQYDNQVNLPYAKRNVIHPWTTNGEDANCFGLEPHFGCCTANFSQGYPKFVLSCILESANDIQIRSYIPLKAKFEKGYLNINSSYPFNSENIHISIHLDKPKTIKLLIPKWACSFSINIPYKSNKDFLIFDLEEGDYQIQLDFISKPKLEKCHLNQYALVDGPLVFALPIKSHLLRFNNDNPLKQLPHADYEVINDENFSFDLCDFNPTKKKQTMVGSPFVSGVSPIKYEVILKERECSIKGNTQIFSQKISQHDSQEKEFVPMGTSLLHMTVFRKI